MFRELGRLILTIYLFGYVQGISVNQTIDDNFGDVATGFIPKYLPDNVWSAANFWANETCPTCRWHPDTSQAQYRTFHMASYMPDGGPQLSISLDFTGTAIYVYFIVPNGPGNTTSFQYMINEPGGVGGTYTTDQEMKPGPDFLYHQLVLSLTGLTQANHTLLISVQNLSKPTTLIFDYAIYTMEMQSGSSLPFHIAVIYGIVGGLILASIPAAWYIYRRRRANHKPLKTLKDIEPFVLNRMVDPSEESLLPLYFRKSVENDLHIGYSTGNISTHHLGIDLLKSHESQNSSRGELEHDQFSRQLDAAQVAALCDERQRELDIRIKTASGAISTLENLSTRNPEPPGVVRGPDQTLSDVLERMHSLREEINRLRGHQRSLWARGLTNDPPPNYSPSSLLTRGLPL